MGDEITLTPEQAKPFLDKIRKEGLVCKFRHGSSYEPLSLEGQPIHAYPHDGGWKVKGLKGLWWLYIVCPKCGQQWALHYLGVPRNFDGSA